MKETRTINLNGLVFHIDNDAYQALNTYLQDIELRLPTDEREDVLTDIEARVSELLQSALFAKNVQVVDIAMIEDIKTRIGAPSEFGENKRPKVKARSQASQSGCGRVLQITLYVILVIIAAQVLLPVLATIVAISLAGLGLGVGAFGIMPLFGDFFFDGNWGLALLTIIASIVAICLPVYVIIHAIVTYMRTRKGPKPRFWIISIICWLLSLGCFGVAIVKQSDLSGGLHGIVRQLNGVDYDADEAVSATPVLPFFNAINANGAVDLDIVQGTTQEVNINDTNLVSVSVHDSVLLINAKDMTDGFRHIHITTPDLKSLTISGASKAEVTGNYEQVHYLVSGASKLEAEDAIVNIVHVNCSGASKADVHAQKELWAQASGASKITYSGNPALKRSMAVGASKIKKD